MTKFEQEVSFDQSLQELVDHKSKEQSYAYTTGYLESLVKSMYRSLPSVERVVVKRSVERSLQSLSV